MVEWECTGCSRKGSAEEIDKHILEDEEGKEIEDIKCWGRFEVES